MPEPAPVRVRFAPSPTGRFHIGGARTALYNYLLARQTGGSFVLRIEDTDQKRYDPTAQDEIMDSLRWLGLDWDEGPDIGGPFAPYKQSERLLIYHNLIEELIDRGSAYYCFCSPERLSQVRNEQQKQNLSPRYDGYCRSLSLQDARARAKDGESHVVRFKTPKEGKTTGIDLLRDPIIVDNINIDDYILLKSDGIPVYHMAAISDDHLMEITHVFRGSEWLPTFPLHVLIYEAFEWEQPQWIHLSVFLNPTGKGKLSKRTAMDPKSGVKSVYTLDLKELGYLHEAVNNWCALMGWSYDDHTEIFPMEDLIEKFSLDKLSSSPAAVNFSKLDHFNGIYIRELPSQELKRRILPFLQEAGYRVEDETLESIIPLIRERIHTLDEAVEMAGFFFQETIHPDPSLLIGKDMTASQSAFAAQRVYEVIEALPSMECDSLENELRNLADELNLKASQLFGILRIAVTGQSVSPPLIESMEVIGKSKVLERIQEAIALLSAQSDTK
ncbi:MAG: glutamate--tRNA ligase [Chloroflexi bacterium RBG_16_48_8]|nr:MAG: glutamate--tRNA ligase [Chloroflexi bacterium RBG_16_48_8]